MEIEQRVAVSQKPIEKLQGQIEYESLDNQNGIIVQVLNGANRVSVRLDPTEEKPEGMVVNFRVEDLIIKD